MAEENEGEKGGRSKGHFEIAFFQDLGGTMVRDDILAIIHDFL